MGKALSRPPRDVRVTMPHFILRAQLLLIFARVQAGTFVPGAICDSVGGSGDATSDYLRGQTLRVMPYIYGNYGIYDENIGPITSRAAWSGIDFEILDELQQALGFEVELVDWHVQSAISKDLYELTQVSDLVMSYWTHNEGRSETMRQLNGHFDDSLFVSTRPPLLKRKELGPDAIFNPFDWTAWLLIVSIVLATALAITFLESKELLSLVGGGGGAGIASAPTAAVRVSYKPVQIFMYALHFGYAAPLLQTLD